VYNRARDVVLQRDHGGGVAMGWERDGIGLSSTWRVDDDAIGAWIAAETVRDGLLAPLRAEGLLAHVTHLWIADGKPRPIGSAAQLDKLVGGWRDEVVQLYSGAFDDPDFMVHASLGPAGIRLTVGFGRAFVDGALRDRVAGLVTAWSTRMSRWRCRLTVASLAPATTYPRPLPRVTGTKWPLGELEYYLGRAWHQADRERAAVLAGIARARLPRGATRTTDGDVLRIALACDLGDPHAVADARAASERWLTPLVPTEPDEDWNELGDRIVVPTERDELLPFTFYDAEARVGYKGLVVDPDTGEIDEAAWSELVGIASSGEAHDGTPVASVRLVFPTRQDALAMYARTIASGFEMALYPKGAALWEVAPA